MRRLRPAMNGLLHPPDARTAFSAGDQRTAFSAGDHRIASAAGGRKSDRISPQLAERTGVDAQPTP